MNIILILLFISIIIFFSWSLSDKEIKEIENRFKNEKDRSI